MKTLATREKRPAPAVRKAHPYVHHPMGPVQRMQRAEIGRILRATGTQAKLTIGQPNDKYEREADRVADQVMAMPDSKLQRQPENEEEDETLQTKPLADQITPLVQRKEESPEEEEEDPVQAKFKGGEMIQRMCPACEEETAQRKPDEDEEETLLAKANQRHTPTVGKATHSKIQSLTVGGQALPPNQQTFFSSRMGYDFSGIRIHDGGKAAETAQAVQAKAFTMGNNIVFNTGQYSPNNQQGKKLLAHELMHVVQQHGTPTPLIHRKIDKVTKSGCSVELEMGIGIYGSRAKSSLATKWQNWINTLWNAKTACHGHSTGTCNTRVKSKVTAHPKINWWWRVPESNRAYVREPNYRSGVNRLIARGHWAVNEDARSIAHETGHLMGQGDKYWNFSLMKYRSKSGFVNDIMANYYKDPGPTKYGPALSRILKDHNINCLCCLKYPPCGKYGCALNPGLKCHQVGGRRHCKWIKANNTPEALANYTVNCSRLPK